MAMIITGGKEDQPNNTRTSGAMMGLGKSSIAAGSGGGIKGSELKKGAEILRGYKP